MSDIRKKLIEVYIPLDDIASALRLEPSILSYDSSIPEKWLPRISQTACSAIMFASMVDDPASCPDEFPTIYEQNAERKKLNDIIHDMADLHHAGEFQPIPISIQNRARYEIARSIARLYHEEPPRHDDPHQVFQYLKEKPLPIHDPFVGGKSILLESQRLRFASIAPDINPLGVLINKALVETPPKYVGRAPINPDANLSGRISWRGASGMANDIQYYGRYIRDKALNRIGHLYPKAISADGTESTIIAWLWARTMPCPNPACDFYIPLLRNFQISTKKNNEHWVLPRVNQKTKTISFTVQNHDKDIPKQGTVGRFDVTCLACCASYKRNYVDEKIREGPMSAQMIAMVSKCDKRSIFMSHTDEHIHAARSAKYDKNSTLQQKTPITPCVISRNAYSTKSWYNLFLERQIIALSTFSDLLADAKIQMIKDGADKKYADTLSVYIALSLGKNTHGCSSYVRWAPKTERIAGVFGQQTTSLICDFAETNPFSDLSKNWAAPIRRVSDMLDRLPQDVDYSVSAKLDKSKPIRTGKGSASFTSHDNLGQTEISDFFYASLRHMLYNIYPGLFAAILASEPDDMAMAPSLNIDGENPVYRFEKLMGVALCRIRDSDNSGFPSSIFYKYDTPEERHACICPTGWETILSALISAGFQIVGTWPMRTDWLRSTNSLPADTIPCTIILVCRERASDAKVATHRQFVAELLSELPKEVRRMQDDGIAPSGLAQSVIGPGMAVFSRYSKVLNNDGNPIPVREAISIINKTLYDILAEREAGFDKNTRWAISWFEQYGFDEGSLKYTKTLFEAKNTSRSELVESGILEVDVRRALLLKPSELPKDRYTNADKGFILWGATHNLIHTLNHAGEDAAARLMSEMLSEAYTVRDLAYLLYDICYKKRRFREASDYNALVQSWPKIIRFAKSYHDTPTGSNPRDDP